MNIKKYENLSYLTFDNLTNQGVLHGIFTRKGGVSNKPWKSLNVGSSVGDIPDNVKENRKRLFNTLGLDVNFLYDVWQIHSNRVVITSRPRSFDVPIQKADAILTNRIGVALFMRFADCVPILLYDPKNQVIGIIHAGWQGTINKIVVNTLQTMKSVYNSNTSDLISAIGPAIEVDHYEVGKDLLGKIYNSLGKDIEKFIKSKNGSYFFDLKGTNAFLLRSLGLKNIEISSICTACSSDNWYSHRAENGKTGRFGAVICLT